jgi:hypothetical protein
MANSPDGFVAGFLRFVLKLFLASIALVFAVCLLGVGLVAVVLTLLKALVTWQKPAPWVVFQRVQKYSARGQWPSQGFSSRDRQPAPNPDVVDVEVREISEPDNKR